MKYVFLLAIALFTLPVYGMEQSQNLMITHYDGTILFKAVPPEIFVKIIDFSTSTASYELSDEQIDEKPFLCLKYCLVNKTFYRSIMELYKTRLLLKGVDDADMLYWHLVDCLFNDKNNTKYDEFLTKDLIAVHTINQLYKKEQNIGWCFDRTVDIDRGEKKPKCGEKNSAMCSLSMVILERTVAFNHGLLTVFSFYNKAGNKVQFSDEFVATAQNCGLTITPTDLTRDTQYVVESSFYKSLCM